MAESGMNPIDEDPGVFDWQPPVVRDRARPVDIEVELSSLVMRVSRSGSDHEAALRRELSDTMGPGSSIDVAHVRWTGEGPDLAWFAERGRLAETTFLARVLAAVDGSERVPDIEAAPLPGGVFGLRAELTNALLAERIYLEGAKAARGYWERADLIVDLWWRDLVQSRPEDFQAWFVPEDWSEWFEEDFRFAGTWIVLDVRAHEAHVVRVHAPADDGREQAPHASTS